MYNLTSNHKSIQMQSRSAGTKEEDDFFFKLVRTSGFNESARSRLSPLREVTSKKFGAIERSYLETVGLLILPKSRPPVL